MRFSLLTTTLTFASYVYAAAVNKRDISSAVQTCVTDLQRANTIYVNGVILALSNLTLDNQRYLYTRLMPFTPYVVAPKTTCCAFTSETEDESNAVIDALAELVPHIEDLSDIAIQNFEFISQSTSYSLARVDTVRILDRLKDCLGTASNCLYAASTAELQEPTKTFADRLAAAISAPSNLYVTESED